MEYDLAEEPIASGLSGTIYSTKDGSRALKYINYKNHKYTNLTWVVEISVLKHLKHRKIVCLDDIVLTKDGCFLVMPKLIPLNSVKVESFKSRVKEQLALDIAEALAYLHSFGLIHTDIKPKNVLIDVKNNMFVSALLCDMGAVQATNVNKLLRKFYPVVKAPKYIPKEYSENTLIPKHYTWYLAYPLCSRPPEISHRKYISLESDVWAYGCFLTSIINGGNGFNHDSLPEGMKWTDYIDKNVTGDLKPTVTACLQIDSDKRPTMMQIINSTDDNDFDEIPPKTTLIDLVCSLAIDSDAKIQITKIINSWTQTTDISPDCVEFCKRLIDKAMDERTKVHFENNAYLPVMICINMALQLFHPQVVVDVGSIYGTDQPVGAEYSEATMWLFRVVFEYDIFAL